MSMETDTTTLEDKCSLWVEECLGTKDPKKRKDELRAEAREFFRSTLAVPSISTDPREGSLAKLIQALGPGFTASLPSRICALSILCGAVEGCQNTDMTVKTANLIISFLMEQCGPIRDDHGDSGSSVEDYDEQVRDSAVACLSALLKCQIGAPKDDLNQSVESFHLRCKIARQGIERRCAVPEEENSHMDHGFQVSTLNDVRGGLSTLPRSRRSLCFSLLQSAVDGMEYIIRSHHEKQLANLAKSVEKEAIDFATFACNCLQGESDPRCLMQLLSFLHKIQVAFEPLFNEAKMASFPITGVFDAVAPYYPINFTPPPHDNHGITQKGLRDALMAVLTHFGYDQLAANKKKDTMLSLSLGIVLERLIPMGGDGDNLADSATEKEEAIDDLLPILFPEDDSTFDRLDKGSVQQLSAALIVVHQQSSVAVSQGGNVEDDKRLADKCRTLISRIACRLEGPKKKVLWKVFVQEPVASISTKLMSPSTEGRVAIAYLACLAASGGPQTLRCALDSGLTPLIGSLKNGIRDEELATAAAYGVGAFFSSCNVAMEKATKNGLVLHPHPLEQFSSDAFEGIYSIFTNSTNDQSTSLRVASVRALESVLVASPSGHFEGSEQEKIKEFARALADCVLGASEAERTSTEDIDFIEACTQTLGTMLGRCMEANGNEGDNNSLGETCILATEQTREDLKGKIFIDILFKAKQGTAGLEQTRYDRSVLARASSSNFQAATCVIEPLLHALKDSLEQHSIVKQSMECARALSHALRNGGFVTARAFHEVSHPSVTAHDIFVKLCDINAQKDKGKTNLDLPATHAESENVRRLTREIVTLLLPAYEKYVPQTEVFKLVSSVSKILPPLSDKDATELSITLPLLSASLESCDFFSDENHSDYETMVEQLGSIDSDLASYSLNVDYDARSRSAASACLHAYIEHFAPRGNDKCPAQSLLEGVITSSLVLALDKTPRKKETPKGEDPALKAFIDCVNLAAVVGSAAACRGGNSSPTADRLASFFVQIACERKAAVPYAKDPNAGIDLLANEDGEYSKSFSYVMSSGAAFGTMLCIHDRRPMWKQRLTHNTFKYLEPILKGNEQSGERPSIESLGLVAVVCHIICAGNFQKASLSTKGMAVRAVVRILVSGPLYDERNLEQPSIVNDLVAVKKLAIASVLKLACSSPGLLSSYIESIVTGLMRAYAVTADSDPLTDIACKLLTLQVFERICHLEIGRKTLLAVRPAVVSILGAAMNHPSRMLREAAVAVRNTWFTL